MLECGACNKKYSSAYNLSCHHVRQPMCKAWLELKPGIKDYVDDQFNLPMSDEDVALLDTKCFICGKVFANVGNLNRHMDTSVMCSKWAMYRRLQPLGFYMANARNGAEADVPPASAGPMQPIHILWNLYLGDKSLLHTYAREDYPHVVSILPEGVTPLTESNVLRYHAHEPRIDAAAFDTQCERIEEMRAARKNVLLYCNSGYQRSIPFICYYLTRFHPDEAPTVERAVDLVLPQVDRANYHKVRDGFVRSVTALLSSASASLR